MQNLLNDLTELLKRDERFVSEGKLLKNKVVEAALKPDEKLLKLLLNDKITKKFFFKEIDGVFVFDKIQFQKFVSNKSFLPDSYTAFSNKIGLTSNDEFISESKNVVLSWPYKDCVLEGGQTKEEEKRKEIFWNETLAPDEIDRLLSPKAFTNFKKFDKDGEHKLKDITLEDNLIIKGNNLLALHSLLPVYRGKVKLIYIDPPYNTGNDSFGYNDSFNHSTWLTFMKNRLEVALDLLDEDGVIFIQCDDNEQAYLKVLCDNIFTGERFVKTIHVQMSIVQGEKVKAAKDGRIVKNGEYLHVYCKSGSNKIGKIPLYELTEYDTHYSIYIDKKNKESRLTDFCLKNNEIKKLLILSGIIEDRGLKTKFTYDELAKAYQQLESFKEFIHKNAKSIARTDRMVEIDENIIDKSSIEENTVYEYKNKNGKIYLYGIDGKNNLKQRFLLFDKLKVCDDYYGTYGLSTIKGDWWSGFHIDLGNINKESVVHLDNGQKPERLLENIIKFTTKKGDLIIDFNIGSGTTIAVAHKMERRYIGIEQIFYGKNDPTIRLIDVIKGDNNNISKKYNWMGGGGFIYLELSKLNQNFTDHIIKSETTKELKIIWENMKKNGFISYKINPKDIDENISEFEKLKIEDQKKFLIQVLDKNHLYVNYSEIDDKDYKITEEDKKLNKIFYNLK